MSLDLSIFDPGSSVAAVFYVGLHELMNALGSRSNLVWSVVDVLQSACKNTAARHALIHTYKFAPILTRLLEVRETKKTKLSIFFFQICQHNFMEFCLIAGKSDFGKADKSSETFARVDVRYKNLMAGGALAIPDKDSVAVGNSVERGGGDHPVPGRPGQPVLQKFARGVRFHAQRQHQNVSAERSANQRAEHQHQSAVLQAVDHSGAHEFGYFGFLHSGRRSGDVYQYHSSFEERRCAVAAAHC